MGNVGTGIGPFLHESYENGTGTWPRIFAPEKKGASSTGSKIFDNN